MRYGIESSSLPNKKFKSLKVLYSSMPSTSGCEECEKHNGSNAFWCCKSLNPSMFYCEFLYIWRQVKLWDKEKQLNLILRAITNYLDDSHWKGCIFFYDECTCYARRPMYCRLYGVIPENSWNKKIELLKSRHGEDFKIKDQCNLVFTDNGSVITEDMENEWFNQIVKYEKDIGISDYIIYSLDAPEGSYRTFHDHLLLELFDKDFLTMLTDYRMNNPSKEDIRKTIAIVRGIIEENNLI